MKVSTSKSTGMKGVYTRLLHDSCDIVAPYIHNMLIMSLNTGIFPSHWKTSQVKPIFKSGSRSDPGNYRPISITPFISKMLENIIHDQLDAFLEEFSHLCPSQSGFRKGFSTETGLIG